jgi:large subunit ribosomal protein L32
MDIMVIRMRHTRAHTANRRSHHALKGKGFGKCDNCGEAKLPHKACMACGKYRGRQVINKVKAVEKKQKKAAAKKAAK